MKVVITGAEGLLGQVLRKGLSSQFQLHALTRTPQDFPSVAVNICDFERLANAFSGADAVIHLAAAAALDASWDTVLASNLEGTRNVYEAAKVAGVHRVVFASSGHVIGLAEERAGPALYGLGDGRIFDESMLPEPDSLYAVSKVYGEVLGKFYADVHGISVICVRIGTVLADDNPRSAQPGRGRSALMSYAERYPRIRAKWLSHRDCCHLFSQSLLAKAVNYAVVFGTSNNPRQIWSLAAAREVLGYVPQDKAPIDP